MHPNPPSASARLGAGTAAADVVAVAHVVSECCVRASNFMKTNPLQNKRAKRNERPTHGLESGSDRGKKGEYIRAAARVSISERAQLGNQGIQLHGGREGESGSALRY